VEIFVFARLHARPGREREVHQAMLDVQGPTPEEPGWLRYGASATRRTLPSGFDKARASVPLQRYFIE
jgi:quinol monooxygenase YgiN